MSRTWLGQFMTGMRQIGRWSVAHDRIYRDLSIRIEERAEIASQEAHAYIDARLAELNRSQPSSASHVEQRAILATQEAKAYADGAIHSLSMALRAMSTVLVRLSQRIENCEAALSPSDAPDRKLSASQPSLSRLDERTGLAVEDELQMLADEVVGMELALRELDDRLREIAQNRGVSETSDQASGIVAARS